jgi:ABC-2 type transport system permease protein
MFRRTKAIAKKEFKQLLRDKRLLFVILFFPIFLLVIFGYAVNFDVKNIQIAVLDKSNTGLSRTFVNSFLSSNYFQLAKQLNNDSEIKPTLDKKHAQVVLVIPNDFSKKIHTHKEPAKIQFLIDGVDGNTATIIKNYVNGASTKFALKLQKELAQKFGIKLSYPILLEPIFWFNPNLQTTKFLIPGLIAMILIITAVISVSLSLVKEKELGTIEQINVSSINSFELLLGKSAPYIMVAFLDAVLILAVGYIFFDVVVKGSYFLLFISTLIYIIASTSIGILISVVSETQQIAFTMATFATMLPSVILSGFIFPIESMPVVIQWLTNITPAKFFIIALRAIIIRGVGLQAFWMQLGYLILFTIFFMGLAVIISRKQEIK